jgi:glyoxylase-like metal-dependent hydrolase (beta-lactamase superfamily II)
MQNFAYLIGDKKAKECVLVDPAWDVDEILRVAEKDGMKVVAGILTHTHFDHCNGVGHLIEGTGAKIYIHEKEAPYLKEFKAHFVLTHEGSTLKIGSVAMTFLHTPGHTEGSQCVLVGDNLVTGDTLFVGACGRCDLPGGSENKMAESLKRLSGLDASLKVYPGHAYGDAEFSTIGQEQRTNPFMKS